ncbi:lectin like domain-containing protein [Eubacteriaceae bacterium ES3]|nr:lectin like domain-containing protein [Eubacteriaceae bacterium ES3]
MKKKFPRLLSLFLLINLLFIPQGIIASNDPIAETGPLNPEFVEFQKDDTIETTTVDGHALGHVPEILARVASETEESIDTSASFPASYDLRSTGRITAVRNQGEWGSCWAFASIASLESYLKASETTDLSENNMMWNHGFDWGPNYGGNSTIALSYLARWSGPVSETSDPYNSGKNTGLSPAYHVQSAEYLPKNAAVIKEALMEGGALSTTIYSAAMDYPAYFNTSTSALYYYGSATTDHDVAIVGWDDNYSRYNFSTTPSGDGAWIIKNSWGSDWGDGGYFYLSYYDTYACNNVTAFHNAESTSNYKRIYQYDPLGNTLAIGFNNADHSSWGANVFTAQASETLTAISTYSLSPNTTAEIYIYTNPSSGLPRSGTLRSSQTVTFDYQGYYTVDLNNPVNLNAGEDFSVVIKYVTPQAWYPVPIEGQEANYSSAATAYSGQSYISNDGGSYWQDVAVSDYANVCIKAFSGTSNVTLTNISITSPANKLTYQIGDTLDISGLEVTGFYSDGSSHLETITTANISGFDSSTAGTKTLTITVGGKTATYTITVKDPNSSSDDVDVYYRTHVQNIGWQGTCYNGEISGTSGLGYRLEAIQIQLGDSNADLGIAYRTHVQNIGWQDTRYDGEISGTSGLSYRLEAIQIQLYGNDKDLYDVYYRVHCQNFGWMGWAVNGEMAGTSGYGYRLEAIQIEVWPKNAYFYGMDETPASRSADQELPAILTVIE